MLANPDIGVTQIEHRLGISPVTLYRYIPAARTREPRISPAAEDARTYPRSRTPPQAGSGGVVERPQWVETGP